MPKLRQQFVNYFVVCLVCQVAAKDVKKAPSTSSKLVAMVVWPCLWSTLTVAETYRNERPCNSMSQCAVTACFILCHVLPGGVSSDSIDLSSDIHTGCRMLQSMSEQIPEYFWRSRSLLGETRDDKSSENSTIFYDDFARRCQRVYISKR